jgi:hypothetical protein
MRLMGLSETGAASRHRCLSTFSVAPQTLPPQLHRGHDSVGRKVVVLHIRMDRNESGDAIRVESVCHNG